MINQFRFLHDLCITAEDYYTKIYNQMWLGSDGDFVVKCIKWQFFIGVWKTFKFSLIIR